MDQIDEMCVCVCVCVENEDEMVGAEDDSELNHRIYRRINGIYFILVPTIHLRMHNAMLLAPGGFFCSAGRLQQGNAGVDEEALT